MRTVAAINWLGLKSIPFLQGDDGAERAGDLQGVRGEGALLGEGAEEDQGAVREQDEGEPTEGLQDGAGPHEPNRAGKPLVMTAYSQHAYIYISGSEREAEIRV